MARSFRQRTLAGLVAGTLALGAGLPAVAAAEEGPKLTVASAEFRRPTGRQSPGMGMPEQYLPSVDAATQVVVTNLSDEDAEVRAYAAETDAAHARPHVVRLSPGETRTMTGLAQGAAYFDVTGEVGIIANDVRERDGVLVGHQQRALEELLTAGMEARVPLTQDAGLLLTSGAYGPGGGCDCTATIQLANKSGNALATTTIALEPYSRLFIPDAWEFFNTAPTVDAQVRIIPSSPVMLWSVQRYGPDTDLVPAQHDAAPESRLPVMQRLRDGAFPRQTRMDTIALDADPLQQLIATSLQEYNNPGSQIYGGGRQLYALTHDTWDPAMNHWFTSVPDDQDLEGGITLTTQNNVAVWTRPYVAAPQGDLGETILPERTVAGGPTEVPAVLLGSAASDVIINSWDSNEIAMELHAYDAVGNEIATETFTLGPWERHKRPVPDATRIELVNTYDRIVSDYADAFTATLSTPLQPDNPATDTIYHSHFNGEARNPEPPTNRVQQLIDNRFPTPDGRFFLNYEQLVDLINGTDRTRAYGTDMAEILVRDPNNPGTWSIPDAVDWLQHYSDGIVNAVTDEFYSGFDPFHWDNDAQGDSGIRFYFEPEGKNVADFPLLPTDMQAMYGFVRDEFLPAYITAFPEEFCGTSVDDIDPWCANDATSWYQGD